MTRTWRNCAKKADARKHPPEPLRFALVLPVIQKGLGELIRLAFLKRSDEPCNNPRDPRPTDAEPPAIAGLDLGGVRLPPSYDGSKLTGPAAAYRNKPVHVSGSGEDRFWFAGLFRGGVSHALLPVAAPVPTHGNRS